MPLLDHFRTPVAADCPWDTSLGLWVVKIADRLNNIVLPRRYLAKSQAYGGFPCTPDCVTPAPTDPAPQTTAWTPRATLSAEIAFADEDLFEVKIVEQADRRLVAAVELISPGNKDRPEARAQFVSKCAALLRQGVSVVLVDVVTVRGFNLYAELLDWVGARDPGMGGEQPATYAAACRWRPRGDRRWLEAWGRPLAVGEALPVLPLWLAEELAVPLDLEASYAQTCRDLRIA